MTITGKKFSQLTEPQKLATREPITGWIVNNLFINSLQKPIFMLDTDATPADSPENNQIFLCQKVTGFPGITIEETVADVGTKFFFVNWMSEESYLMSTTGATILPYQITNIVGLLGVFQIERTGLNEWTVSVIENGTLVDGTK